MTLHCGLNKPTIFVMKTFDIIIVILNLGCNQIGLPFHLILQLYLTNWLIQSSQWHLIKFGTLSKDINWLKRRIASIQASPHYFTLAFLQSLEVPLNSQYQSKLDQLETFWAQHSCIQWLQLGDRNTNYFHFAAKIHSHQNHIYELYTPDGSAVSCLNDMHSVVIPFF